MNADEQARLQKVQTRCNDMIERAAKELCYAATTHAMSYGCAVGFSFKAGAGDPTPAMKPLAIVVVLTMQGGLAAEAVAALEACAVAHCERIKRLGGKIDRAVQPLERRGGDAPQN